MQPRSLLATLALFLAGCVGAPGDPQGFPSLARRPVETRDFDAEQRDADARAAAGQAAADPALAADVAKLDGETAAGVEAFDRAYPAAEREVAAAASAGVGSDAYAGAQSAISGLEASRNRAVTALASLDSLYAARVAAIADGSAAGGDALIAASRGRALAAVDAQNDRLDRLKDRLPLP